MSGGVTGVVVAAVIVVFAVIGLFTGAVFLPARVEVGVEDANLAVRLHGLDVFWCLRSSLTVPLLDVAAVRVAYRDELPRPGLRLPGASLPGLITAGSYGIGGQRTFWDVRRADRLLLVECRPGHGYRSLVLEVPDPDRVAATLGAALARRPA